MALFALVSKDFTRTETGERASEKVRKEARDWDWREEEQIRILNDLPEIETKYTLVYCTLKCIKEQQNPLEMKKKFKYELVYIEISFLFSSYVVFYAFIQMWIFSAILHLCNGLLLWNLFTPN